MEVTLRHLPAQADFYACQDRYAAFVGGLGYGKTMTAADWILTCAVEYPDLGDDLWIFSNTYSQLRDGTLRTLFEQCDEWGLTYKVDLMQKKTVTFPDIGATIHVRSADRPINFKSLEISRAWIDEAQAYPRLTYQRIIGRLRGSKTQRALHPEMALQIRLTANPPHEMQHWLVQGCTIPDRKTGRPPITYFTASTYDNPFLSLDYIEGMESQYDDDLAEIELGGKFGTLGTGKIWRAFDRGLHVLTSEQAEKRGLPPLEYDPTLPLCWSQDFNIDPLSTVFFQWRQVRTIGYQSTVMYVLDEMRIRNSMIEHAVREFVENRQDAVLAARRHGIRLYGDATGRSGNRQTGESDWAALIAGLEENGFRGMPMLHAGNPFVVDRYNAGNAKLVNARGEIGVVINAEKCRYLPLDLESMVYKVGTRVVDARAKLADGATVTHCLVGNTMIATEIGSVPLSNVINGDRVWTRNGLRKVLKAARTGLNVPTIKLTLSTGETVRGTTEHLVWRPSLNAFVPLGALAVQDDVSVWNQASWNTPGEFTSGFQDPITSDGQRTDRRENFATCIATCGRIFTDSFQPAITSIIAMVTRRIMRSKILNALVRKSIVTSTWKKRASDSPSGRLPSVWLSFKNLRKPGTGQLKGELGMQLMQSKDGRNALRSWLPALSVMRFTPRALREQNSVRTNAPRSIGVESAPTMYGDSAPYVVRTSRSTVTNRPKLAVAHVEGVCEAKTCDVYDLTVEGEPEFFANGVLVHNSADAWSYPIEYEFPVETKPQTVTRGFARR